MIKNIQQFLIKNATGKNVLIFFILAQLVYAVMLIYTIPKIHILSGGMRILDLMPSGYDVEYVKTLAERIGESGREIYVFQQIPLDMIYPGLFAVSLSLLLTYILQKSFSRNSLVQNVNVLPIIAGIFDYLENIGIATIMGIYPTVYGWVVDLVSVFSVMKSITTTIALTFLLIVIFKFIYKKVVVGRHIK